MDLDLTMVLTPLSLPILGDDLVGLLSGSGQMNDGARSLRPGLELVKQALQLRQGQILAFRDLIFQGIQIDPLKGLGPGHRVGRGEIVQGLSKKPVSQGGF